MANWQKNIISGLITKRITQKKIREAYLVRDSKYLKKAYKYGRDHSKRLAVKYMGEISNQENFDFLITEINVVTEIKLKAYIYASIMKIALDDKIRITNHQSEYLNQNLNLLENIGYVTEKPKMRKSKSQPITFRNRLKDHLGILEEMKKDFEIY